MKTFTHVPPEALESQATAADPAVSAWVSANAGSGKTHVLARRVIRLLLDDVEPGKILCLTYTKAAAANMSNRIFGELSRWTMLDAARLADEIGAIEGRRPDRERLARARRLFARALETPGGLKIQTIHAFCEAVLHQFPLEANIAGHFELLDDKMEMSLAAEARRGLIGGAATAGDRAAADAFAAVLSAAGEAGLDALLDEILAKRDDLRAFIDEAMTGNRPFAPLFEEFGFEAWETAASVAEAAWPLPGLDPVYFQAFAAAAEHTGAASVVNNILPKAVAAFAEADPVRRLMLACEGLLKSDGDPYDSEKFKKALLARLPDLPGRYAAAASALVHAIERLRLYRMLEATAAALVLADRLIGAYERLKSARGFLDFNDLIRRTVRLLARPDASAWVQYKLDRGIDHILVDEAQDTSPEQWEVIRRLAEEFFAGSSARDNVHRTVFAVGDEKQSIYSFQGAEPAAFADNGEAFRQKVSGAGGSFEKVRLRHSFRSTEDVLAAVDTVFALPAAMRGVAGADDPVVHAAVRAGLPGFVELWPSLGPDSVEEPDDWTKAVDVASAPAVRLANMIAAQIAGWVGGGERIEGRGTRLRPGDVMVLVRRRDAFVHALSRALKSAEPPVPVAGADRLRLQGHIAVRDLTALARFLLLPDDDLSLAAVLRSPVFGLSEEELFAIAWERGEGVPLHRALGDHARTDRRLAGIAAALDDWANRAAFQRPFDFFAGLLAADGLQARFVARLGSDTTEILDEFLGFCLAEEKTGLPGLEAFLATLETAGPEIKREMDQTRDEIRIMTVHAAKGLEAPVVFLVDNGAAPFSSAHLPRLVPLRSQNGLWRGKGFLWRAGKDMANAPSRRIEQAIAAAAEEEYRRLLYVGMTRAEDRLIVCGYHGARPSASPRWHGMVTEALAGAPGCVERPAPQDEGRVRRLTVEGRRAVAAEAEPDEDRRLPAEPLPIALRQPPPPPPVLPRPLSPSGASATIDADAPASRTSPVLAGEAPTLGVARGTAIHRLLQSLPDCASADRESFALRYLERVGGDWPAGERERAWKAVARILADPGFERLVGPQTRAEVSLMGTIRVGSFERAVAGKIDRLVAEPELVTIVDYKTNRPAPSSLGEIAPAHVAQMALYRELVRGIYPDRQIAAALLYTETPALFFLPGVLMDEALARLAPS